MTAWDMWFDLEEAEKLASGARGPTVLEMGWGSPLSRKKEATIARETRALHRSLGLCAYCKTPSLRYRCANHYDYAHEERRRRKAQQRATGATIGPMASSGSKEGNS